MTIIDYLRIKGIEPKQVTASGEHASPCPACGGNDRFVSRPDTGRWFCRGCSPKGGDLIDLVKMIEGVDYKTACQITGTTPAIRHSKPLTPVRQSLKQIELPPATWQKAAADFVERSHQVLLKNERVLSWLKSERLIELETVKRFKLGWNAATVYTTRQAWGLPEKINLETGRPRKVWLPCGLVIPCHDIEGRLIYLKIRQTEATPRYVLISGLPGGTTAPALFGQISPVFIVVESELDAVLIWQNAGDVITPVSAGGVSMRPDLTSVKVMAAGSATLVSLDTDKAGKKLENLLPWKNALANFRLHPVPAKYGKDHTGAALAGLNLRAWVIAGLPPGLSKLEIPPCELQPLGVSRPVDSKPSALPVTESHLAAESGPAAIKTEFAAQTTQGSCNEIILAALVLSDKLKAQSLNHEAEQLDTLLGVLDKVSQAEPQQNMTAALYYLERFLERYRHAG